MITRGRWFLAAILLAAACGGAERPTEPGSAAASAAGHWVGAYQDINGSAQPIELTLQQQNRVITGSGVIPVSAPIAFTVSGSFTPAPAGQNAIDGAVLLRLDFGSDAALVDASLSGDRLGGAMRDDCGENCTASRTFPIEVLRQ